MLPNTDYEVRYLNPDDVEQYNALLRYSFQITEQDLSECGWRNDEIKQSRFPVLKRADVLGCFDAGALVSQIAVYPVKMNVYGSACPAGFVTSVCTYPEYTGNGIMKRLMRQSLEHMRRKELIYLSREAQEGLWEYIRAHDSMIDEVRGSSYFSDPIAFELEDGDIRETIRPYIMGRIVDVEQFFQRYRCDPAAENAGVSFEIEDRFLPWNNKTLTVRFHRGECGIAEAKGEGTLRLSIATLTTLLLGYNTAARLYRMGRITGDEETVRLLDEVLFHETPYISDYI